MVKKIGYVMVVTLLMIWSMAVPAEASQNWMQVYTHIEQMIHEGVEQYNNHDIDAAKKTVNDSYYGVYEKDGLEKAIRATISSKNANLTEYQYGKLKKAIRDDAGAEAVRTEADTLLSMIKSDVASLDAKGAGGGKWSSFIPAFVILLREGMEALLILVAIMAYLGKSGNEKYLNTVYNYSIAAVVASFATAYVFSTLLTQMAAGAHQEMIEGFTALFAVAVLLYMSFWMGRKAEARAWKAYIDNMMKTTLTTGRARALGVAAFLAVYREGAEVVLFYQALFNGASGDVDMIWYGFLAGCAVLAIIFAIIHKGLFRIPLRPFFIVTGTLMYIMAVSFAGGGISELQEAQVVSQTVLAVSWFPHVDWLGLYPTYETVGIQILLLIVGIAALVYQHRKNRKLENPV